jgi:hypothetical protein
MPPARRARNAAKTPAIATLEHRLDLYVSTLRRCIAAMGGTLEVVAHFPAGQVPITAFGEVEARADVP